MIKDVTPAESSPLRSIQEIFLAARDLPSGEQRDQYLDEVVGEDQDRRRQVEQMIASQDSSQPKPLERAIEQLDLTAFDATDHSTHDLSRQPQIGPYKLLSRLGTGGMGEVFVAEQRQPVQRTVALKLIKRGMDSKEVLARFEAERQALALMSHPNIASVLDAGETEDGRPYFVMDLVRGIPITEYCDRHKLNLRQRLELMVTVCQAVQHAHQKGIIHRDLKPGNILVVLDDVRHVPKVIDFGVAKATNQRLTERTLFTQLSQMIGTPMYMSPEQAQMTSLDVDTRSDVYSLGVLLYELLTGSTPFDKDTLSKASYDELRRIIQEDEPPRPSHRISTLKAEQLATLSSRHDVDAQQVERQVARELDWIVMKALEKDRDRRYESASGLAADLQRYLDGDLVLACPPSAAYRIHKFIKRRPHLIAAAAPLGIAILFAVALLWNERNQTFAALTQVTSERQLAQGQKQKAEEQEKQARENAAEAVRQRNAALLNQYYSEIVSGQTDQQQGETKRLEQTKDRSINNCPVLLGNHHDGAGWLLWNRDSHLSNSANTFYSHLRRVKARSF